MIITENSIYTKNYDQIITNNLSIVEESYKLLYEMECEFDNIRETIFNYKLSALTESVQYITEGTIWESIKRAISNFAEGFKKLIKRVKNWFLGLFKKQDPEKKKKVENGKEAAKDAIHSGQKEVKLTPEQMAKLNEKSNETKGYTYDKTLQIPSNGEYANTLKTSGEEFEKRLKEYKRYFIKSAINNDRDNFAIDELEEPRGVFLLYLRGEKIDNIYKYYMDKNVDGLKEVCQKGIAEMDNWQKANDRVIAQLNKYVDELKDSGSADVANCYSKFIQVCQKFQNLAVSEQTKAYKNKLGQINKTNSFFARIGV